MKHAEQVVDRVLLTEKGARLSEKENKYTFQVHPKANKVEIKSAVERLFKVGVTAVNTATRAGKAKRNRRMMPGFRTDVKRAIVTLKPGDKIEFT